MKNTALPLLRRGFTLVELLIVVIILAVLAAIVIPQFSSATTDTQEAALDSNLAAMRNAIELYKAQHSAYPGAKISSGGGTCAGATGTGNTANSAQAFIDQLTAYSNAAGQTCTVGSATYKYGPYVRKGIPNEPINQMGSTVTQIAVASAGTPIVPSAATGGWSYDAVSGQFVMNSNAKASDGVEFFKR